MRACYPGRPPYLVGAQSRLRVVVPAVRAVQVEHIRLTLGLKAFGCQPVESTSPFKVLVSSVNLHPYVARGVPAPGLDQSRTGANKTMVGRCTGSLTPPSG